jgi:hypothetical protein
MPALNMVSRCPQWYELNLAGLRFRELRKATNFGSALVVYAISLPFRIFGAALRGGMLFPREVTVMWDVPLDEVDIPEEFADLGFTVECAFELPEFSGENVTCLLLDRERTTFAEVLFARIQGMQSTGIVFSSELASDPPVHVKTTQKWEAAPLDYPDGYVVQCVPGLLADTYEAHYRLLKEQPQRPRAMDRQSFFEFSHRGHRRLGEYYVQRGVWIPAREEVIDKLLEQKGLEEA